MRPLAGSTVAMAASPSTDFAEDDFCFGSPGEPVCGGFISGVTLVASRLLRRLYRYAADGWFIAHEAGDEGDFLAVRGPRGIRNLQRRLVDGLHEAENTGVERVELGDVPVVVAIAVRGDDGEARAVRRPVVFVDVHIRWRALTEFA